ncbi:MAG TPA: FecR family protein [Candidatus Acidoferrum sp.]|nr:FecR family protein [Candidatus Acidoferrum sp.]
MIASAQQSIGSLRATAIRRALPRSLAGLAALLLLAIAMLTVAGRGAAAADLAPAPPLRPWVVQELKGAAFTHPHGAADDGASQALRAGMELEPGSVVRTDGSGRVELTNGIDTIRLSPSSEIELPAGQSGDPVTRVIHWLGSAFFHVGKRPGPQFEVDTPYIVAIVKGTKFTTTVSDAGASIKVTEGVVGVSATAGGSSIDVTAGGSASVSAAHSDTVTPGPSGDASPAGGRGKGSTLASTHADPSAGVAAGGGGADEGGVDSATARGGSRHGGNGNGNGRDDHAGEDLAIGNDGDQGSVVGGGTGNGTGTGNSNGTGSGSGNNGGCYHSGRDHHGHHGRAVDRR